MRMGSLEHPHAEGHPQGGALPPGFPKGLRVLVVDDDSLCLKVVEQMLRKCDYKATTCINGSTALRLLRERPNDFDLVLSDVYMPDMDGFKLLEMVGLEMDLPVIMMSSNGETSTVLRGVTHGAVDFLIKPVRIEELRNVWQHVVRRKRELVKDLDSDEHNSQDNREEHHESGRKRKEAGTSGDAEHREEEANASKKPRVTWSVEMHQKFVGAVNQLGVDKAVPKKILDIMNVEGLTRENVASHLQKYRLYLKRVQGAPPHGHVGGSHGRGGHHGKPSSMAVQPPTLQPGANGSTFSVNGGAGMANGHAGPSGLGLQPGSPTAAGSPGQAGSDPPAIKTEPGQASGLPGPVGGNSGSGTPALGPDAFPAGTPPFPGAGGMLNNPMGLGPTPGMNPLMGLPLNPMGMNPMGMGGPLGMPPLPNPLGMGQPGMPGMGPMGMPGMPGMNLNPLNFMPGMGMPPLGMGGGMMGPPLGMMGPGMNMGMPGMGMTGMGMGSMPVQQGQPQAGTPKPGMGGMPFQGAAPYMPSSSPMPGALPLNRVTSIPGSTPGAAAGAQGASTAAGGAQGMGLGVQGAVPGGDPLEMGDLAGPLGELLQGDAGGPNDMAALLNMDVGDLEGGFPDLDAGAGAMGDSSLTGDNKEQGNFDELFNLILKS